MSATLPLEIEIVQIEEQIRKQYLLLKFEEKKGQFGIEFSKIYEEIKKLLQIKTKKSRELCKLKQKERKQQILGKVFNKPKWIKTKQKKLKKC